MAVPFPTVPIGIPGIPPALSPTGSPARQPQSSSTQTGVAPDSASLPTRVTWGIYGVDGALALEVDSVVAVEPLREFRVSDYPTEAGGFQSFNKVATPADVRMTVTRGGSLAKRQDFLDALDRIIVSLDPYNIVTPDAVYIGYTLVRQGMRRTATNGVSLLSVDLMLQEIRDDATARFVNSQSPAGDKPVNVGPVQAKKPTDAQTPPKGPLTWI